MALPVSLSFMRLGAGKRILEFYVDPQCPFSAKLARSLTANVFPLITQGGKYEGQLSVIARLCPQPFHYMSVFQCEALLAFGVKHPDLFWNYLTAVFDHQTEFFNHPAAHLTPSHVRDRLVEIAMVVLEDSDRLGSGPKSKAFGELRDMVEVKKGADGSMNGGNDATWAFKYLVKMGRQIGITVTPTVLFDGLKEDSVSSSWGKAEWEQFLEAKMSGP